MDTTYTFDPANAWPTATAAVASHIGKRFSGVFTTEEIKDIIGDVVCKMWNAHESYDPSRKLFSWVWRIAQNTILDAVADKNRRRGISGDIESVGGNVYVLPVPNYAVDDDLIYAEAEKQFVDVLKNARDKRIFYYLLDGLDNKEIARREGISDNAAGLAVFHLRKRLTPLKGSA